MDFAFEKTDEYIQYMVIVNGRQSCRYDYYHNAYDYAKDVLRVNPDAVVYVVREVVSTNRIKVI